MILSNGKLLIDDTPNNVLKKSNDYNNILVAVEEKSPKDLKKELLTLNKFKIDPALASGVILTTITDVFGFLSFLGLASILLI